MSRNQIFVHPVDGHKVKGAKNILTHLPHYYLPGLNTYSLSSIKNSNEAIQYYSAPDHFNLPIPCITFSDIESSNILFYLNYMLKCNYYLNFL